MIKFEPLEPPYDKFSVTNEGHVINLDTELYVKEQIDFETGKPYVVLDGSHNKTRKFFIAQLVADMFVPNVHNLGYLYYKDGNVVNCSAKNIGYAINPQEANERVARPHRTKVEPRRHELIVEINNQIEKGNWTKVKQLGKELWELEGSRWEDRNK